jgi:hypothetical protein
MKEISENNIKRFTDERKRLKIRQSKQIENLFKKHQNMMDTFMQDCEKVGRFTSIYTHFCSLKLYESLN